MYPSPQRFADVGSAARVRIRVSFRVQPAAVWRKYLAAIADRDVEVVLETMTVEYARQLRALRPTRDFGPLFELWCASQPRLISVTACFVAGDTATLEGREGRDLCRVQMRQVDGVWRVSAEEFIRGSQRQSQ